MLLPRHNYTMHRKEAEKSPIETMEAFLFPCYCANATELMRSLIH